MGGVNLTAKLQTEWKVNGLCCVRASGFEAKKHDVIKAIKSGVKARKVPLKEKKKKKTLGKLVPRRGFYGKVL